MRYEVPRYWRIGELSADKGSGATSGPSSFWHHACAACIVLLPVGPGLEEDMHDKQRDEQVRAWIAEGPEEEVLKYEDEVMWGVWFNLDDEGPPVAMFGDEDEADEYARSKNVREWHVSPCLVGLKNRNHYDVPERTPAESSSP